MREWEIGGSGVILAWNNVKNGKVRWIKGGNWGSRWKLMFKVCTKVIQIESLVVNSATTDEIQDLKM